MSLPPGVSTGKVRQSLGKKKGKTDSSKAQNCRTAFIQQSIYSIHVPGALLKPNQTSGPMIKQIFKFNKKKILFKKKKKKYFTRIIKHISNNSAIPAVPRCTHSSDKERNAFWELRSKVLSVTHESLQEGLALSHCRPLHSPHTPQLLFNLFFFYQKVTS